MSGVAAGRVEALVRPFPGADVHEPLGAKFPGEDAIVIVPVLLPVTEPRIATGIAGGRAMAGIVLELMGEALEPGMRLAPRGFIAVVGLARLVAFAGGRTICGPVIEILGEIFKPGTGL
jgi:hypothetical protein